MSDYNFERIPLWSNDNPQFEVMVDDINGRIPVTRLENWKDFAELLESEFFNQSKIQLVFRGHRRYDWELMPTLARVPESGIIDEQLAIKQLDHFKRAVRGRLTDNSLVLDDEEDELWSVGQHHGLNTPLLDWTYSPYVALFFAFSKEDSEEEKENAYRAIYVLNKTFVADDEICPDIRMFEPRKDDHGRLVNQAGLFTFSPYGSTIENKLTDTIADDDFEDNELKSAAEDEQAGIIAKYICKIYIKNEDRKGCMRHLRRMNVHHASLFPDLIGASDYSNLVVAEEWREYEVEAAAKRVPNPPINLTLTVVETNDVVKGEGTEEVEMAAILQAKSDNQVEPGRIQIMAEKLTNDLPSHRVVDWTSRDSAISAMRSSIRILLRRYGYPAINRDSVVDKIIEYQKGKYGEDE